MAGKNVKKQKDLLDMLTAAKQVIEKLESLSLDEDYLKKHATRFGEVKIQGKHYGVFYTFGSVMDVFVDANNNVYIGSHIKIYDDGSCYVTSSSDGKIPAVVKIHGNVYKTKNPEESILYDPNTDVLAKGYYIEPLEDGFIWVSSSKDGKIPGVIIYGDQTYKTENPGEELLFNPKDDILLKGSKIDFTSQENAVIVNRHEGSSYAEFQGLVFESLGFDLHVEKSDKGYVFKPKAKPSKPKQKAKSS